LWLLNSILWQSSNEHMRVSERAGAERRYSIDMAYNVASMTHAKHGQTAIDVSRIFCGLQKERDGIKSISHRMQLAIS
jgi:hypothetical protein